MRPWLRTKSKKGAGHVCQQQRTCQAWVRPRVSCPVIKIEHLIQLPQLQTVSSGHTLPPATLVQALVQYRSYPTYTQCSSLTAVLRTILHTGQCSWSVCLGFKGWSTILWYHYCQEGKLSGLPTCECLEKPNMTISHLVTFVARNTLVIVSGSLGELFWDSPLTLLS